MNPSQISPSDLERIKKLEQEALDKNMDLDYETLTLIPIQDPVWSDDPEEDRRD